MLTRLCYLSSVISLTSTTQASRGEARSLSTAKTKYRATVPFSTNGAAIPRGRRANQHEGRLMSVSRRNIWLDGNKGSLADVFFGGGGGGIGPIMRMVKEDQRRNVWWVELSRRCWHDNLKGAKALISNLPFQHQQPDGGYPGNSCDEQNKIWPDDKAYRSLQTCFFWQ